LQGAGMDLCGIKSMKDTNWERLDIPLGIGMRLQRNVSIYKKGKPMI
jgi:hypothetical protein